MKTSKKSKPTPKVTEAQHKSNLQTIALFISGAVRTVLLSELTMRAADLCFVNEKDVFTTNPANTVPYRALHGAKDAAIVQIAGALNDENRIFSILEKIRQKGALILHRDAIGHPNMVSWHKPVNQQFIDDDRQWRDVKAALVWDMQRSVNELLTKVGGKIYIDEFAPGYENVAMLHLILNLSMKVPDSLNVAELQKHLVENIYPSYRTFLEKHPDGQLPGPKPRTTKDLAIALKIEQETNGDADEVQGAPPAPTS